MTQLNSSTAQQLNGAASAPWFSWRYLRFGFALVLLISAVLKWRAFGSSSTSPLFEIAPQLELLLIQFEFVLACWLMVGWLPVLAWGTTLILFGSFAGASLMMVIQGRSTCGCLGTIEFNPIWMLLFDSAALVVLIITAPNTPFHRGATSAYALHGGLMKSVAGSKIIVRLRFDFGFSKWADQCNRHVSIGRHIVARKQAAPCPYIGAIFDVRSWRC